MGDEPHGAEDHVRPARRDLPAPAAARRRLLRPQPGRPTDDAGHDRRRCAERTVHFRRHHDLRRHLHPGRHRHHSLPDEFPARAGHLLGSAAPVPGDVPFQDQGARFFSTRAHGDRPHQRLPSGEHYRDRRRPDLQPGAQTAATVRGASTASISTPTCSPSSIMLFSIPCSSSSEQSQSPSSSGTAVCRSSPAPSR